MCSGELVSANEVTYDLSNFEVINLREVGNVFSTASFDLFQFPFFSRFVCQRIMHQIDCVDFPHYSYVFSVECSLL